jgi:hypothetical protein
VIKINGTEFLFHAEKRLEYKGWVSDLVFTVEKERPTVLFYLSALSSVAYFNVSVYPFSLTMLRYDNLGG